MPSSPHTARSEISNSLMEAPEVPCICGLGFVCFMRHDLSGCWLLAILGSPSSISGSRRTTWRCCRFPHSLLALKSHYWPTHYLVFWSQTQYSFHNWNIHIWISKHALESIHGNPRLPVVALLMFEQWEGVGWPRYAVKKIFGRAEANLKQTDEDRTEERGFTGNIRFNQIAQYSHHRYLGWPPPIFTAIQPCAPSQSPLDKLGGFRSS